MENRDSDELNALTSQVVDYYKRYSQNPNLSSYLRGGEVPAADNFATSVDLLAVNVNITYCETRPPLIGCDNDENDINVANVVDDQLGNPSPTSSITSTRKLEWDNLADIGYGNCQKQKHLHKSLSLPVLTALEKIELGNHKLRLSPEGNVADNATQTQPILKSTSPESTSTSSYKKVSSVSSNSTPSFKNSPQIIDSTSSFSSFSKAKTATTETDFTDIESTAINSDISKVFQNCIGLPMAESTSNNVNIRDNGSNSISGKQDNSGNEEDGSQSNSQKKTVITPPNLPVSKDKEDIQQHKSTSPEIAEIQELQCVGKCIRSNIKHLSLTKPLSVECTNYKEISDKVIQTSTLKLIETASVSVQTEQHGPKSEEHIEEDKIYPVYGERQIVEYIIHGGSPEGHSLRSLGTNTDSDGIVSKCNSFQFLYGESTKSPSCKSQTSSLSNPSRGKFALSENKLRRARGKSNLVATTSGSSNFTDLSSKSSPLADLITAKLSKHVIGDVDKSICMLQKLLKSKKYDKITKQYYVKKIVQKIINCDYSSETSVNSEPPSQSTDDNEDQIGKGDVKLIVESSEEPILEKPVEDKKLPAPFVNEKALNLKKQKQFEIRTFSTEILPEQTVDVAKVEHEAQQSSKLKDARFTITNSRMGNRNSDEFSQIGDTNPENTPSPRSTPQSAMGSSNSSAKASSFKNWKDELTLSEKLLEQKMATLQCGDGSSNESELLLNFAKKERENQISWINNEINHLNKLKDMLQRKRGRKKVIAEKLTEPRVGEMFEKNKTTSVYVITTEKRSGKSSASSGTNSLSAKSAPTNSSSKICKCSPNRGENQWCDSNNCLYLKYRPGKGLNKHNFERMLKNDIENLPHLVKSNDNQNNSDIENAKLIASDIYKDKCSDYYVRRFVFEMPIKDENITDEKYKKILSKNCNVNADMRNAKIIGSELVQGSLPNTHIRRFVFEIPICADESSKVICPSPRKTPTSSRESSRSRANKCSCRNKPALGTCKCTNATVCTCSQKQRPPHDNACPCDIETSDHPKTEVSVKGSGTGDNVPWTEKKPQDDVITKMSTRKVSDNEEIQFIGNEMEKSSLTNAGARHGRKPQSFGGAESQSPDSRDRTRKVSVSDNKEVYVIDNEIDEKSSPINAEAGYGRKPQSFGRAESQSPYSRDTTRKVPVSDNNKAQVIDNEIDEKPSPINAGVGYGRKPQSFDRAESQSPYSRDTTRKVSVSDNKEIQPINNEIEKSSLINTRASRGRKPQSFGRAESQSPDSRDTTRKVPVSDNNKAQVIDNEIDEKSTLINAGAGYGRQSQSYGRAELQSRDSRDRTRKVSVSDNKEIQGIDNEIEKSSLINAGAGYGRKPQSYGRAELQSPDSRDRTRKVLVSDSKEIRGTDNEMEKSSLINAGAGHGRKPQPFDSAESQSPVSRDGKPHSLRGLDHRPGSPGRYRMDSPGINDRKPLLPEVVYSEYKEDKTRFIPPAKQTDDENDYGDLGRALPVEEYFDDKKNYEQPSRPHYREAYFEEYNERPTEDYYDEEEVQSEIIDNKWGKGEGVPTQNKREQSQSQDAHSPTKTNKSSQYENQPQETEAATSDTGTRKKDRRKGKRKKSDSLSSSPSSSSPTSSSNSASDSSEDVPRLCLCCNRAETKYRSVLRGLPEQLRDALCEPCYARNQQINWPHSKPNYAHPGHVCSCYTVLKTETVRKIQRTVNELENLEREREVCSCTRECRLHKHGGRRERQRRSTAYMLTFEDVERTDPGEGEKRKNHRQKQLEEVRVRVPQLVKKKHKDRENRKTHKRDGHGKHRNKHHNKHRDSKTLTLQDYLRANRPNFVANAEERRKALIELSYLREERCQKYKQLLAMSNGVFPDTNIHNKISKPRMFTSKEMKQITAKNYKKLPEVQRKLEENRNNQIKRANKILADIFNKKLRDNVLKGRLTLSTNTSLIKLP